MKPSSHQQNETQLPPQSGTRWKASWTQYAFPSGLGLAYLSFKTKLSLSSYLHCFTLLCLALGRFVSNEIGPTYTWYRKYLSLELSFYFCSNSVQIIKTLKHFPFSSIKACCKKNGKKSPPHED